MKTVIWPANIDAQKSRAQGRKISMKDAVPSPNLGEIETAAESLGISPKVEPEKAYPRAWWEKSGRVQVTGRRPKMLVLREIAREIRNGRS